MLIGTALYLAGFLYGVMGFKYMREARISVLTIRALCKRAQTEVVQKAIQLGVMAAASESLAAVILLLASVFLMFAGGQMFRF